MGSSASTEYCAFTKAVEHLGDRWSLLIVRELATYGPQGFNGLAGGLPGRISRSVLADRLRRLEELGLVGRNPLPPRGTSPYELTPAGEQLVPTLMSLWQWAEKWVPEDPRLARRDPLVVLWWLRHRVVTDRVPERQVAIELVMHDPGGDHRSWLLLARGSEPQLCLEDPLLGAERYVYVEGDVVALDRLARGQATWSDAVASGAVRIDGEPELRLALADWFTSAPAPAAPTGVR